MGLNKGYSAIQNMIPLDVVQFVEFVESITDEMLFAS